MTVEQMFPNNELMTVNHGKLASIPVLNRPQELKSLKQQLEQHSTRLMDKEPVLRMRDAVKQLQNDLQNMHVHTGMLQHVLLSKVLAKKVDV